MTSRPMPLSSKKESKQSPAKESTGIPTTPTLRQLEAYLVRALALSREETDAARQRIDELVAANAALGQAVREHARREAQALHIAYHDELTGLPNRRLLQDRLNQALAQAARSQQQVAVFFLDLDDFKTVNDRLGHTVGDTLLRRVAERLVSNIRSGDTACRYGGDEFVILLPGLDDPNTCTTVKKKLQTALAVPYAVDGVDIHMAASVGMAVHAGTPHPPVDLIGRADRDLYCAKAARSKVRILTQNHTS